MTSIGSYDVSSPKHRNKVVAMRRNYWTAGAGSSGRDDRIAQVGVSNMTGIFRRMLRKATAKHNQHRNDAIGALHRSWGYIYASQIIGDYFEFGVHQGNSLVASFYAFEHFRKFLNFRQDSPTDSGSLNEYKAFKAVFFGMDSFCGMPENNEGDLVHTKSFQTSLDLVSAACARAGLVRPQIQLIPGLFSDTARTLIDHPKRRPAAGLGRGFARSWQWQVRRQPDGVSWARVSTSSPRVISAYAYGATIRGRNGNWLAIPVEGAVPLRDGWGRVPMSPVEVEARFNQDLQFVRFPGGRTAGLVMTLVRAQSGRGWRTATPGRVAQGRQAERVLMFVLVRQVQVARRLDLPRAIAETLAAFPDVLARELP